MRIHYEQIYFDYNSTSPLVEQVKKAMDDISALPLNSSSSHNYGRLAKKLLEDARREVANAIGASEKYNVIFTSSGTEANNLAMKGMQGYKLITSTIEHPSVLKVVKEGVLSVDSNGVIKLDVLEKILRLSNGPALVSVMLANNEIGVIQPIRNVVSIAHKYNAIVHTDASQALGKIEFNLEDLGVDLITLSAHKFGGPVGVGALVFKKNLPLNSIMMGGGQEFRFRPGTQNIPAIHGFGIACKQLQEIVKAFNNVSEVRNLIEKEIQAISPSSVIFGQKVMRLPNVTSITMPGVSNKTQIMHFDLNGFAVSAGSACSSGKIDLPYVQMALGFKKDVANSAIRVSLGPANDLEQAKKFIECWKKLYQKTKINNAA